MNAGSRWHQLPFLAQDAKNERGNTLDTNVILDMSGSKKPK